jgi:hypothetical protein
MSGDPEVPFSLSQNPAPYPVTGQGAISEKEKLVQRIMEAFREVLPSNYVAQANGPWYSLQFQAMVEQLADAQLEASEIFKDSAFDFTRPEFLYQVLGVLVFPDGDIPRINGDTAYRVFLRKMIQFLLDGAKTSSMKGGIEALESGAVVQILENYLDTPPRNPVGAYSIEDQFGVEIFFSNDNKFPTNPEIIASAVPKVLTALKPAHVVYSFSFLFTDTYADSVGESLSMVMSNYYYDDARKNCFGAKRIQGTSGEVLSNRYLLSDATRSFIHVHPGAVLTLATGEQANVLQVLFLRSGTDATPRLYATSPTGLVGSVVCVGPNVLIDTNQNWGLSVEGEIIEILSGPNAGTYRLDVVMGSQGGPVGQPWVSGNSVRISPSILRTNKRLPQGVGQTYEVTVDRLGVKSPKHVSGEKMTIQCVSAGSP